LPLLMGVFYQIFGDILSGEGETLVKVAQTLSQQCQRAEKPFLQ